MFFFQMKVPPEDSEVLASFLGTSTWHDLLASSKRMVVFVAGTSEQMVLPLEDSGKTGTFDEQKQSQHTQDI